MQHHRIARSIADDRRRDWERDATMDRRRRPPMTETDLHIVAPMRGAPRFRPARAHLLARIAGLFRIGAHA